MFADLFTDVGQRSVPPVIVAVVMVLQRIEGRSDREAADRFRVRRAVEVRGRRARLRLPRGSCRRCWWMRPRLARSARRAIAGRMRPRA